MCNKLAHPKVYIISSNLNNGRRCGALGGRTDDDQVKMKMSSQALSLGFWGHPGLALPGASHQTVAGGKSHPRGKRGNSDQPSSWPAAQSRLDKSNLNAVRRALFLVGPHSLLPGLGMYIVFVL